MNALPTTEPFYVVETPMPNGRIDPDLKLFFHQARKFLDWGVQAGELSSWLNLEKELVRSNLGCLLRLGFVRLMDVQEAAAIRVRRLEDESLEKNAKFLTLSETLPGTGVLTAAYVYYFLFC